MKKRYAPSAGRVSSSPILRRIGIRRSAGKRRTLRDVEALPSECVGAELACWPGGPECRTIPAGRLRGVMPADHAVRAQAVIHRFPRQGFLVSIAQGFLYVF